MHGCFVISAARVGTRVDAVCEIGGQGPGIPVGFSIAIAIFVRAAQRIGAEPFITRPVRVKRGQKIRQRNALFLVHQHFYGHQRVNGAGKSCKQHHGIVVNAAVLVRVALDLERVFNGSAEHIGRAHVCNIRLECVIHREGAPDEMLRLAQKRFPQVAKCDKRFRRARLRANLLARALIAPIA